MTLPAFAAERRAAAPGCGAAAARRCPSISFARTALSSKPAARRCCVRLMGQTDGRTDGRTPDRFIDLAAHRFSSKACTQIEIVRH